MSDLGPIEAFYGTAESKAKPLLQSGFGGAGT